MNSLRLACIAAATGGTALVGIKDSSQGRFLDSSPCFSCGYSLRLLCEVNAVLLPASSEPKKSRIFTILASFVLLPTCHLYLPFTF